MTAVVPDDGSAGLVTVTTPSGTLTSNRPFFVTPVVSSISPTSGPVGTQVTVTGSGLEGDDAGKVRRRQGDEFYCHLGHFCYRDRACGAKSGKVAVTTGGGGASSKTVFTVTP